MFNYYHWSEISTLHPNLFWLDSVVAWEDATFLLDSDIFISFSFLSFSYLTSYFALLQSTFLSFTDVLLITSSNTNGTYTLVNLFYYDLLLYVYSLFFKNVSFMLVDNVDLLLTYLYLNPEYFLIIYSFYNELDALVYSVTPSYVYDVFSFDFIITTLDYLVYLKWMFMTFFAFLFFFSQIQFSKFGQTGTLMFRRLLLFFSTFSTENRMQYDWALLFLMFVFSVWLVVLMTYDDVNVEIIELFHFFVCLVFVFAIFVLIYKYSIHYFAFLENSVSDGYTVSFIAKQFVRDVSNSFALFLRFFLLIFRLNIYDGLDDFLDSYYIFFIDFDEDSYFDELFFYADYFFYFSDNHEDNIYYAPAELDWTDDIFSKYFVIWGKFFFFWAFILEEAFRVTLAFYISYLIIFEVHAVNVSYSEDSFVMDKRN